MALSSGASNLRASDLARPWERALARRIEEDAPLQDEGRPRRGLERATAVLGRDELVGCPDRAPDPLCRGQTRASGPWGPAARSLSARQGASARQAGQERDGCHRDGRLENFTAEGDLFSRLENPTAYPADATRRNMRRPCAKANTTKKPDIRARVEQRNDGCPERLDTRGGRPRANLRCHACGCAGGLGWTRRSMRLHELASRVELPPTSRRPIHASMLSAQRSLLSARRMAPVTRIPHVMNATRGPRDVFKDSKVRGMAVDSTAISRSRWVTSFRETRD